MQPLPALRRETRATLCLACGKCSTLCPLASSTWFSAARLVALREAEPELDGRGRAVGACLTCGACEERCPEGVRFSEFVRGVRALAPPGCRSACPHGETLQAASRLMAAPRSPRRRLDWVGDDLEISEEGEVALFVGCLPFFDLLFSHELELETIEIARSAIRLLNRIGVQPVVLAEERCCGHDLLWNGEPDSFEALARANAETFAARGVRRILTTCAECCRTWRLDYPAAAPDYRPQVEHLSEFLASRLESGELTATRPLGGLTYQDPCRLGRHLGATEAPRRVLEALAPDREAGFVEMRRSGRDAVCCGTTGFIHCDANSRRLQTERLAGAAATGAETLVTACPKCLIHFRCAQAEDRRRGRSPRLEVQDLTVLAAGVLEPAPPADATPPAGAERQKGAT